MSFDPKWLQVLKGDDRLAVAIACGVFLLVAHFGWFPSAREDELNADLLAFIGG
jgi:hypothetical protein